MKVWTWVVLNPHDLAGILEDGDADMLRDLWEGELFSLHASKEGAMKAAQDRMDEIFELFREMMEDDGELDTTPAWKEERPGFFNWTVEEIEDLDLPLVANVYEVEVLP